MSEEQKQVEIKVTIDETPKRANWIGAPAFFNLNQACIPLVQAFGFHLYLVGSCCHKRDFRDVDIRCILPDEEFDAMFPNCPKPYQLDAKWSVMSASISAWLKNQSGGLPIDFQFQRQTDANAEFGRKEHVRQAIGFFVQRSKE